jgi:transcription elongation factor Elf1
MPRGNPSSFNFFTCPNCGALYEVVKLQAAPETDNREITCSICDDPLAGRKGEFVLKYFLLRKAIRSRRKGKK